MEARSAMKKAELLSTMGAGVLGAGIALLLARWVGTAGLPLLIVGVAMHSFGMYQKRKLEDQGKPVRPRWENALYWICWMLLAAVLGWAIAAG
jgi:hypothetical protein